MAVRNKTRVVGGASGVMGGSSGVMGTVQETETRMGDELRVSKSEPQRILKAEESVMRKRPDRKSPDPSQRL